MIVTTIDRTATVAGPAVITHNGTTYIFEDALTLKFTTEKAEIKVNGIVRDYLILQRNIILSGKPVAMFRALGAVFPYGTGIILPGGFVLGADAPLLLQPYDTTQPQTTFPTALVTKMPDLFFSAGAPLYDSEIEFTCLGKNATLPNDPAYRYVEAANTFNGDTYDASKLIVQPYDLTHPALHGGNPFDTEAGVKVAWNLTLTARKADSVGTYQFQFTNINPTATFIPIGVSPDDVRAALGIQGANAVRGTRASATGGDLVINNPGGGVYFKLPHATLSESSEVYGTAAQRVGQVTASPTGAAGTVASPFYVLTTAAPQ